jgi:hypothetical protein
VNERVQMNVGEVMVLRRYREEEVAGTGRRYQGGIMV